MAIANRDEPGEGLSNAHLVTQGFSNERALNDFVYAALREAPVYPYFHSSLFIYQGISPDRLLWDSLWNMALVLGVVIIAASVSLIYNSFAISVAERMRQFGLLSSIGASKKQLRRSVLFEALLLGVVAVPAGIVAGIAGVAVVFTATQDALASQLRIESLPLVADPAATAFVVVLSSVMLLASAWIPALRAGRASAIDAIRRTRDVRLSRGAMRKAHAAMRKGLAPGQPIRALRTGLVGRLFGVPGYLARKNLTRTSGRGRSVAASLAASVVLVVAAGAAGLYLAPVADRASSMNGASSGADVVVAGGVNTGGKLSGLGAEFTNFKEAAESTEGIDFVSSCKQGQSQVVIPAAMISQEGRFVGENLEWRNADIAFSSFGASGNFTGVAAIFYIDQASWDDLLREIGVDEGTANPSFPHAVALNQYLGVLPDNTYADSDPFASTGLVDFYAVDTNVKENDKTWVLLGIQESESGEVSLRYRNQYNPVQETIDKPVSETAHKTTVEVIGLTDKAPAAVNTMSATGHFPAFILCDNTIEAAEAAAGALSSTEGSSETRSDEKRGLYDYYATSLSFKADDHAAATKSLKTLADNYQRINFRTSDITESAEVGRNTAGAVQLFVSCFVVITLLIAVANVFNTLSSSIMLRSREFAVLKSCGMGDRAFARMLACECASYAVRGLAGGLALSALAAFLMYRAMSLAFSAGLEFALPWSSVGLAVALVLAVLVLSVLFALHRSRASNTVDALRIDSQ